MKIGLIAPIPSDGTSWYRAVGPFSYISRTTGAVVTQSEEWDWSNVVAQDVMFLQRPFTHAHLMVARTAKALGVGLWADWDDLYSGFPTWILRQRVQYGTPEVARIVKEIIALADVVSVTTEKLKAELNAPQAEVIPNALNTYVWPILEPSPTKIVSWRGSGGHTGDFGDGIMEALRSVARANPDWRFVFVGIPPYTVCEFGEVIPWMDSISYMQTMLNLRPSVHIVPLADCPFNRCKSNIAWLEATAAGAAVVGPNFDEWRHPGLVAYTNPLHFANQLQHLIANDVMRKNCAKASHDFIRERRTLTVVNQKRIEILKRFQP